MSELTYYPRPLSDTGIGFRLAEPDYAPDRFGRWLSEATAMGGTWLVVPATLADPIPEAALRSVVNAGVEPVVHIVETPIRALDRITWRETLGRYAGAGARYVCAFSEPNLAGRWTGDGWSGPGLIQRLVDVLVPFLEASSDV